MLYTTPDRVNHKFAVSRFRLLWGSHSLELDPGSAVFGRGDECELQTDDPLVSRQHARLVVTEQAVSIEDLGSRNGISVNGQRIGGITVLNAGDRVRIGSQELTVMLGRDTANPTQPPAPTRRFEGLAIISELMEKAIALGRIDEAERLVEGPFVQLLEDLAARREMPAALISHATKLATRVVVVTSKRVWVERLLQLYLLEKRPWPADVIDTMYEVARRVSGLDRSLLRAYVAELRNAQLGPADRFLARRIEGLERQFPIP